MQKYRTTEYLDLLIDGEAHPTELGFDHDQAVYLASDVDALVADVQYLMHLNDEIRRRLELPHGWNDQQIASHSIDLRNRDDAVTRIKKFLGL